MRILIVCGPMYGHVNTLLPLALAAHRAGHEVVVATGADLVPHVQRRGLTAWPVGLTHAQAGGSRQASWVTYFAASAVHRAADLLPRAAAWRPELVIHEETELAGPVAAAVTGARHAVHGLGLMPPVRLWTTLVAEADLMGRRWGVHDMAQRLAEATYLHICPPSLQPPGAPDLKRVLPVRPAADVPAAADTLPRGINTLPYERSVHLTLGTVFNGAVDVLATAIAGLRELPVNLIVTAGPDADLAQFGPQPAHVLIERYVSHALLLPRCHLVVSQGGAGIMFAALSHGLPQLVIPQGGDQFMNADACREAGVALTLAGAEVSAQAIRIAALRLLEEPRFGIAARATQIEIDAMPDAEATLARLTLLTPFEVLPQQQRIEA